MKKLFFAVVFGLGVLCAADKVTEIPVYHNCATSFRVQDDALSTVGKCYVIPRGSKPLEFGFYGKTAPKGVLFRRYFSNAEISADGKYHLLSLGYHLLPAPDTVRFFVTDGWGLMLDFLLDKAAREQGTGALREISVSLRADEQNFYLDKIVFTLPEQLPAGKAEIFQAASSLGHCKFPVVADTRFFQRKIVQIPQTGDYPLEFGFYDVTGKKVIFRQKIAAADIPADGCFRLYPLGEQTLPETKTTFWCHESWNLNFTPALEAMQKKYAAGSKWQIFAGIAGNGKTLSLDQLIFVEAGK